MSNDERDEPETPDKAQTYQNTTKLKIKELVESIRNLDDDIKQLKVDGKTLEKSILYESIIDKPNNIQVLESFADKNKTYDDHAIQDLDLIIETLGEWLRYAPVQNETQRKQIENVLTKLNAVESALEDFKNTR